MRTLIRASVPVAAGNRGIKDGTLPRVIAEFTEKARPESIYFTLRGGQRTMYAVIDLKDPANMPSLLEPLFSQLDAEIDASPCMNAEDLKKGMQQLSGK